MPIESFAVSDSPVEAALESAILALRGSQSGSKRHQAIEELSAGMMDLGLTNLRELQSLAASTPHQIVGDFWRLSRVAEANNSLRGVLFEHLVELILVLRGVSPVYTQVTLSMVPNVRLDLVTFPEPDAEVKQLPATGPAPICISLKTSLRERYKQAELEAAAVRGVYRWAKCYLLTLDSDAARTVNAKIERREVAFLESVVVAGTTGFDEFVDMLAETKMTESPQIATIHSNVATIEIGSKLKVE